MLNGATDQYKPPTNQTHTKSSWVEIFQVMTAVLINVQVFWGALTCRLANRYWRFGRVCCLQLHGLSVHLLGLRYAAVGGSTLLRNVGNYWPVETAWNYKKTKFTAHLLISWRFVGIRSMWNSSNWLRNKWTAWCHGNWCRRASHKMS